MRLTTKTRYGIRALFDMAFHCRGRATQAKDVAQRQGIPLRYLEQVLQDLRRAGLVEGKRGPRGGYRLARAPDSIKLGDAVRASQGPIEALLSLEEPTNDRRRARRRPATAANAASISRTGGRAPAAPPIDVPALVWKELTTKVAAAFDSVTVRDLVTRAEALGVKRAIQLPPMYFI